MRAKEEGSMTSRNLNFSLQTGNAYPASVAGSHIGNYRRIVHVPVMMPYRIDLQDSSDTGRRALEEFIHATFKQAYGANVQHFLPRLMSLKNDRDELTAAVGFHAAQNDLLFLEQYLDGPIENVVSEKLGENIQRCKIMEVGNLAVATAGGARGLIIALTSYIKGAGFDWVVFTAVPSLINSFKKMGLDLIPLAKAKKEHLISDCDQWGSYYDGNPMVVAGDVKHGFKKLEQLLKLEYGMSILQTLWNNAYAAGHERRNSYQYFCDNLLVSPTQ